MLNHIGQSQSINVDPENNNVSKFLSIELQALDITRSVHAEFISILESRTEIETVSHGLNLANVKKRYITQLIQKGFVHHHWNSKIVAIVQDVLFDYLKKAMSFDELPIDSSNANIVFMCYQMIPSKDGSTNSFSLARVFATSHNSLMMASLYRTPPPKAVFLERILKQITKK